jgi:Uma2 family endonuclease
MNVVTRAAMTVEAFLDWEERQELRYEFDGMAPRAMVGGTAAHAGIQANLLVALGTRLRGNPCRPFGSELKLRLAHSVRYPDAMVICTPVAPRATWVTDPTVVFEILSESTAHQDMVVKNAEYEATPSIQRYVIIEQTHKGALVFARKGGEWVGTALAGDDAVLCMPEIGIEIPLSELYEGVGLVSDATAEPL